jgi:hypothetical protein
MSSGPEAHIEQVENGYVVELFDQETADANMADTTGDNYECPWKEFIAPTLEEAFNIIRAKLPTGMSKQDAMSMDSKHQNQMAADMARSRFGKY